MKPYPIVLIAGKANTGKDYISDSIVNDLANFKPVKIAFADPIKRIVKELFGVKDEALWGPSDLRNQEIEVNRNSFMAKLELMQAHKEYPYDFIELAKLFEKDVRSTVISFQYSMSDFLNGKDKITVRSLLQYIGTGWGRSWHSEVWQKYTLDVSNKLLCGGFAYDKALGLIPYKASVYDLVVISDGRFRNEILSVKAIGGVVIGLYSQNEQKAKTDVHVSEQQTDNCLSFYNKAVVNDMSDRAKRSVVEYVENVYIG